MPTVAAAWHRGLLLLLFPTMVFLVLAFLGESIGEAIFEGEASENVVYYLILFVFFVLLPLRIILGKRLSNRERLGQGFDADGRGVTIPKAPRPFSWIPRESVGAITTDKDSLGPFVTMEVYATSIELPLIVADTLTDAGYEVSDPMGALVRRMDPDELGEPKMPDLMADETGTGRPASFFGRGYDTSIDDHLSVPRSAGMALSLPLLVAIPAVIAGLVLGWYASLDADVLEEGFRTGRSMLATFPVALGIYLLLMLVLMRTNFGGRWKWKLSPAVLTAVVVALMVAFAPVYASTEASVFAPNMDARVTDELPENTLEIRPYVGEDLEVAGAITVGPGENLSLVGTRLSFRGPDEGMRGLWVAEGGTLHVENSTIERLGFHEKFAIEIQGTAMIRNSYITYNSDGQDDQERNRGLVVRSDDVSVVNTTFNGMFTVAILVISASSVVEGCSFSELGEYGIFIHRSDVEIADTLFSTCENPVMLTQSEARVSGCQFVQCPLGMVLWQSEVDVTDCLFTNTTGTAFFESPESEVRTSNNTYNEVGNLTRDYMFYYSQKDKSLVTTLMLGAMTMANLVSANGHRP